MKSHLTKSSTVLSNYDSMVYSTTPVLSASNNNLWLTWHKWPLIIGSLLLFFGLLNLPFELARIFSGSLNRGTRGSYYLYPNYNADLLRNSTLIQRFMPDIFQGNEPTLAEKGIVPFSALGINSNQNNFPIQDKYVWPWTHPALLFSILTIAAGILGIISAYRKTYASIYIFFVLSLTNWLLSSFLIAYFATTIFSTHTVFNSKLKGFYPYYLNYAMASVLIAFWCLIFILSMIATFVSCYAAGIHLGPKARLSKL